MIWMTMALGAPAVWHDAGRSERTWVGFDTTGFTDLPGFTVLVRIEPGDPLLATPVADLRVLDESGAPLSFDAERWEATEGLLWVHRPTLEGGRTDQGVYVYGDAAATATPGGPAPLDAWPSEYRGVWHFATPDESTGRATSELVGSSSGNDGRIGLGQSFDGSTNRVQVTSSEAQFDIAQRVTVSAWVKSTDGDGDRREWEAIVTKGDDTYRLHRFESTLDVAFSNNTSNSENLRCNPNLQIGTWVLYHGVYDQTAGDPRMRIYRNGTLCSSRNEGGAMQLNNRPLWIGNNVQHTNRHWQGALDEVRVVAAARDANWIAAEYANQTGGLVTGAVRCERGGDGDADGLPCALDCDDTNPAVQGAWFRDPDGDGYGVETGVVFACVGAGPGGDYAPLPGDCDPADPRAYPTADEVCDGVDNDCDSVVDLDAIDRVGRYRDQDGDQFGDGPLISACPDDPLYADVDGDCDDGRSGVSPAEQERCDVRDRDCDGDPFAGANNTQQVYPDGDNDGFGAGMQVAGCPLDPAYATNDDDCDDLDPAVNPDAVERCTTTDENCDGDPFAGASDPIGRFIDADGDGHGSDSAADACPLQDGYADVADDCEDGDAGVSPSAAELCGVVDENCDGDPFAGAGGETVYVDDDLDGYGTGSPLDGCAGAPLRTATPGDCDDTNPLINPAVPDDPSTAIREDCGTVGPTDTADTADTAGDTGGLVPTPPPPVPTPPVPPVPPIPTGDPVIEMPTDPVEPTGVAPPPPSGCTCAIGSPPGPWGPLAWMLLVGLGWRARRGDRRG